jgi:ubiquinone/menaquinone biosynthesis C-methylase UbiE
VDIVTGGYALRNAPDLGTAIDEISRVLKPCGVAAFLDFSKLGGSESAGLRWSLSNRQPATLPAAALRRELWSMVDKESVNAATETTNHRWSAVSPFADPLKMEIQ